MSVGDTIRGSTTGAYRHVLALPGVTALTAVGFAARIPLTMTSLVLTLHVAVGLDRGFAAAGVVGGAVLLGTALGAPLLGRLVDRRGLRPVLALTAGVAVLFWGAAPRLDVVPLTVAAFVAGLGALPAFSVIRQSLASAVPADRRRPAFALDAMSAEVSYIVGPAVGTAVALALPGEVALRLVGAGYVLAAATLAWLDPPTRDPADGDGADAAGPGRGGPGVVPGLGRAAAPPLSTWLRGPMLGALAAAAAAILLLSATELGVVAALTARGETGWFAAANTVWCLASLVGGFVFGAARRPWSTPALLAAMALASVPVAFGGPWWLVSVLLVPAGVFCAPSLASSAEAVGRLAPESARGLATGFHGSAIMLGAAVAAPLAGVLIDRVGPPAAVLAGVVVVLAVAAAGARTLRRAGGGPRATAAAPPG